MKNFNFRIGTYSGDTLWSVSWVKTSQLRLYNIDSDLDATGDWALSLTAVFQQGEDAKAYLKVDLWISKHVDSIRH